MISERGRRYWRGSTHQVLSDPRVIEAYIGVQTH
jgi:ABC-type branched-subunit amino acid transport system ATPase component